MAITFRSLKGTAITHAELDQNFREFIYSGSVSGSDLILYRSQSDEPELVIPLVKSSGPLGAVNLTAPGDTFTGSHDFKYDQVQQNLFLTGSLIQDGDQYVNGTIYARQFRTTLVSASIIYQSGSTKFGDSADDQHNFLGYVNVVGNVVATNDIDAGNNMTVGSNLTVTDTIQSSTIIGDSISGSSIHGFGDTVAFSSSVDARLDAAEAFSSSLNDTFATDAELSAVSSSLKSTVNTVSSSLQSSISNAITKAETELNTSSSAITTAFTNADSTLSSNLTTAYTNADAAITSALTTAYQNADTALSSTLTTAYQNADTALSSSALAAYVKKTGDIINGNLTITGNLEIQGTQTSINSTNLVVSDKLISIASGSTTTTAADGAGIHVSGANALFTYDSINNRWESNIPISASIVGQIAGTVTSASHALVADTALSIDYSDVTNTPTIPTVPTNVSAFTNDAGYTTFDGAYSSLSGTPTIPTNNNQLTNGAGYITSYDITTQTDPKYLRSNATDTASGVITFSNTTASTSTTTGAVKVTGGVGIGGALFVGGDVTAFASSDERLKDNVTPISNAIDKVNQIGGYEFDWNSNSSHSGHDVGVLAQEIEKVLPEIVATREDGYKAVRYEKIVALLIEAVKEQQLQIDELKSRL